MRELRQKLGCMVLLLLAALIRGHLDARLWRILLRFDLRLVEEIQLSICNLRQDPRCPFRAGPIDHLLQLGNLGLEHLVCSLRRPQNKKSAGWCGSRWNRETTKAASLSMDFRIPV